MFMAYIAMRWDNSFIGMTVFIAFVLGDIIHSLYANLSNSVHSLSVGMTVFVCWCDSIHSLCVWVAMFIACVLGRQCL